MKLSDRKHKLTCFVIMTLVLIKMGLYWPNFSLLFLIHLFLYAGVYCTLTQKIKGHTFGWTHPSLQSWEELTVFQASEWLVLYKKTFACGPTLRERFVRGYLRGSRQKDFRTTQILEGGTTYHLVKTCKVVVRLTVNCLSTQAFLAKSGSLFLLILLWGWKTWSPSSSNV